MSNVSVNAISAVKQTTNPQTGNVVNFRAGQPVTKQSEFDSFKTEYEKQKKKAEKEKNLQLGLQIFTAAMFALMVGIMGHQMGWYKKFKLDFVNLDGKKSLKEMAMPESQREAAEGIKNYIEHFEEVFKKGGGEGSAILMYGPPGTGKNTFAYAIAKEFKGAKFVDMDVSKMNSKWHGESEQNILGTMKAAIKYAKKHPDEKIFVFIDEIDSVMMQDVGSGAKLSQDILNAFKKGFNDLTAEKNIIVIGATNLHIDPAMAKAEGKILDSAMLDRFGEKVLVGLPDKEQIKTAITNFYKNSQRAMIDDALKDINNPLLDKIAEFLAKPEHGASFRKIELGICKRAGRKTPIGKNVTYDDFIEAIKYNKANLNITDEEMNAFLKSLSK